MMSPSQHIPVLIIGAGPSGLTAACELSRHGIACRIIDQKATPTNTSNALAVHPRSLDMWADMGILDKALQHGTPLTGASLYTNKLLAHLQFDILNAPHAYTLGIPQSESERLLNAHLKHFKIEVERCKTLTQIRQKPNGVEATLTLNNGNEEQVMADWLLACDGYHSTVRKQIGIDYQGHDLPHEFAMIDAPIDWDLPTDQVLIFPHPLGSSAVFPMPGSFRTIIEISKDPNFTYHDSMAQADFTNLLKTRWIWPFALGKARWTSHFFIHERLAEEYQKDRIFLLGDAAHVHSPAGGQGMNTGMQDAYNLAWKLALTIKQKIHPTWLSTYQSERRPIAQTVLRSSETMTRMMTLRQPWAMALRNLLVKAAMKLPLSRCRFAAQITGLSYHYRRSPLSQHNLTKGRLKAGDRAPTIIQSRHFVLLINKAEQETQAISTWVDQHHTDWVEVRLLSHDTPEFQAYELQHGFCLIRPDQYVATRGRTLAHLQSYLKTLDTKLS